MDATRRNEREGHGHFADELRPCAAELLGTFALVAGGVGTAVIAGAQLGPLGVAFAFGLILLAMVYAIGPISGCHVNPAVTLGLLFAGKTTGRRAAGYMLAQTLGAVLGALAVLIIAKGSQLGYSPGAEGLGANGYGAHSPGGYNLGAAFLGEVLLTFLFVFTVIGATDVKAPVGFAGVAIGLALTLVHLVGIPITNTSVNPARSIGPAVFVGGWALQQLWLFIVAPMLGAGVAAAAYRAIRVPAVQISAREAERALPGQRVERVEGLA